MFLQKLLKKLAKLNFLETIQHIINNNFKEIFIIIGALWLIILIIIIFVIIGVNSNKVDNNKITKENEKDKKIITTEQELVNYYDFELPDLNTFDLTYDYIEFRPKKYYILPKPEILENDYKIIIDDSVNESLKFNFEKRKSKYE